MHTLHTASTTANKHDAADGSHTTSYYAASANKREVRPPLSTSIHANVFIVGSGSAGYWWYGFKDAVGR